MNRKLADRILAANEVLLDKGEVSAVGEFFAPSYVVHLTDRDARGHKMVRAFVDELRRAFADLRAEVEILAGEENRVAWQRTLRGTHRADFQGFPASGRPIVWRDALVTRFEKGLIAEEWAVSDLAERLLRARSGKRAPRRG